MVQQVVQNSRNIPGERSYSLLMECRVASVSTVNTDEGHFTVNSASMHVTSKMELPPEELETVKVFRLPTTVTTANGSIDTTEEATEYARDLDMLVTVQLLEGTPALLSLEKLCGEHGYSYEWKEVKSPNPVE